MTVVLKDTHIQYFYIRTKKCVLLFIKKAKQTTILVTLFFLLHCCDHVSVVYSSLSRARGTGRNRFGDSNHQPSADKTASAAFGPPSLCPTNSVKLKQVSAILFYPNYIPRWKREGGLGSRFRSQSGPDGAVSTFTGVRKTTG